MMLRPLEAIWIDLGLLGFVAGEGEAARLGHRQEPEFVVDCKDTDAPGFWVRDGDMIEVPEK
ncbi:MAG: hypothetical protein U1F98_16560 [Verrucomicrobiota bacterium]